MRKFTVCVGLFASLLGAIPFSAHAGTASLMCSPIDNADATNRFQFRVRHPGKGGANPAGATITVRASLIRQTKFDRPSANFDFTLKEALSPAASTTFEGTANAKSCSASAKW